MDRGEPWVFKSPWSSSGRGVVFAPEGVTTDVRRRVEGFLRRQGGCLRDRLYGGKVADMAMEFYVGGGDSGSGEVSEEGAYTGMDAGMYTGDAAGDEEVEFMGYSLFRTSEGGRYVGNLVSSQGVIRNILGSLGADLGLLGDLVDYHRQHLRGLGYRGPVGVDMMLLSGGRVHPVVEINFRRTMGMLASAVHGLGLTQGDAMPEAVWLTPRVRDGFHAVVRRDVEGLWWLTIERVVGEV